MENIFSNYKIEKPKVRSQRAELIDKIYAIYTSPTQKMFRRKQNWLRYCQWCRDNKLANLKENQAKFKKSKHFIREHNIKSFCYFMSVIPTADLYYVVSVAKDMNNRGQNFSSFIMGNLMGVKNGSK